MTPTPRTDAAIAASDGQWSFTLREIAQQLERELAVLREQIAILRSDEKRLMQFAKTYRLRADEAEEKIEQERQDRKQADLDALRALGERNDARAEVERMKFAILATLEANRHLADGEICTLAMLKAEVPGWS
jgi:transcriptional regulator of NAD metabolism